MRIDVKFGSDTGMSCVDVLLETQEELLLSDEVIENAAWALIEAQGIHRYDVVDLFTRVLNDQGAWVPATRNTDGKLVPVSW